MVDYHKSTGSSGTMRIRDLGTTVEFWITSGNGTTFVHELPWKYTVNGSTSSWQEYDYNAGAGYRLLGTFQVHTSQTVTFYLGSTGTSGFGGPTTFSQFLSRSSVPGTPSAPTLSEITDTSVRVTMVDPSNGGSAITSRQVAYRGSNNLVGANVTGDIGSDKTIVIEGLTAGAWYFWCRANNANGSGNWSTPRSTTTLTVPDAPSAPVMSEITQISAKAEWTPNDTGGSPITGYDLGWGSNSSAPTTVEDSDSPRTVTGLTPGLDYWFWVRAKNAIGESPWSPSTMIHTIPGAWVKVGSEWKQAIPYVRDGGVWKVARPWVRVMGVWREVL